MIFVTDSLRVVRSGFHWRHLSGWNPHTLAQCDTVVECTKHCHAQRYVLVVPSLELIGREVSGYSVTIYASSHELIGMSLVYGLCLVASRALRHDYSPGLLAERLLTVEHVVLLS